jgi:hypothetical protein
MNTVLEVGVIGFGIIGAAVAGNAARKLVERNGGTESEVLAAGCVAAGLSVAVLPAAAVAGLCVTVQKGYEVYQDVDLAIAEAKAKTLGTMDRVVNKPKVAKIREPKAVRA